MLRPSKEFDAYARAVREAAAAYYKCSPEQVFNHRFEPATKARQVMMAVMRQQTKTSYPMLGWLYGKHHTGIMNGERCAEPAGVAYVLESIKHIPVPPPWKRIYVTRHKQDKKLKNAGYCVPSHLIQAKCPRCAYNGAGRDDHDPNLLFCPRCDHDWYPAKRKKKHEVSTASVHAGRGCDSSEALRDDGLSRVRVAAEQNHRQHPPQSENVAAQGGPDIHGLGEHEEAGARPDSRGNQRASRSLVSAEH